MKKMLFCLVLILLLASCAPAETNTNRVTETKPSISENSHITVQHIVTSNFNTPSYIVDYVEDKENGYGCYIYDGSESGSIFCFKLDQ